MGNNYTATTNPTATSDLAHGYNVGDFWLNTSAGKMFQCRDSTNNAAKWIGDNPITNVKDWGAVGDARSAADGSINAGSAILTSPNIHFATTDVGRSVSVFGAGPSGAELVSTISSVSGNTATLANNASTNVSGATVFVYTDDTGAVTAALNSIGTGDTLYFPPGTYVMALILNQRVNLKGANAGTTLIAKNPAGPAVTLTAFNPFNAAGMEDLSFANMKKGDGRIGVQFGQTPYAANQEFVGGYRFRRVAFNCDTGILKQYGNIGNHFEDCAFNNNYYGIYAWNSTFAPAPPAPVLGVTSGGSQGARTAYVKITYVNSYGETVASAEASISVPANNLVTVQSPPANTVGGAATGWYVYATNWGPAAEYRQQPAGSPTAIGTNWTEPTTGFVTGTTATPAFSSAGVLMHTGSDVYDHCLFQYHNSAAIYYDSPANGGGQVSFNHCIIQSNPGFGLFINNFFIVDGPGIALDTPWFEANGGTNIGVSKSGPGGTPINYSAAGDLYVSQCGYLELRNSIVPKTQAYNGSCIVLRKCGGMYAGTVTKDASSVVVELEATASSGQSNDFYCDSIFFGFGGPVILTKPRSKVTHRYSSELVYSNSFSNQNSQTVPGANGNYTSSVVPDGTLFDSCQELAIPAGGGTVGNAFPSGLFNVPVGKYYVWTLDLKITSANAPAAVNISYNVGLGSLSNLVADGKWRTYAGIQTASPTIAGYTQQSALTIVPNSSQSCTVRYGAFQVLAFDTAQQAVEFLMSGYFASSSSGGDQPRRFISNQVPTSGSWNVGDTVWFSNPAAGAAPGAICVQAGSPGAWKNMAVLAT